jgi:hypothetical protein
MSGFHKNESMQARPMKMGNSGFGSPTTVIGFFLFALFSAVTAGKITHQTTTTNDQQAADGSVETIMPGANAAGTYQSEYAPSSCLIPEPSIDFGMRMTVRCGVYETDMKCDLSCCCNISDVFLVFERPSPRVKRQVPSKPQQRSFFSKMEPLAHTINKLGWTPHLLIVVLSYMLTGSPTIPVALLAGMAFQETLGCADLKKGSVISAGGVSWVDFELSDDNCLRIVGDKLRVQISITSSNYTEIEDWRVILTDCRGSVADNDYRCLGSSHTLMKAKEGAICRSEVIPHGWGTKCLFNQATEAITCVQVMCAGDFPVQRPIESSLRAKVHISGNVNGKTIKQTVDVREGHSTDITIDGKVGTINCPSLRKYPVRTVLMDGRVVPEDFVLTASLPQREGNRTIGLDKAILWGETKRGVREASGVYVATSELQHTISMYPKATHYPVQGLCQLHLIETSMGTAEMTYCDGDITNVEKSSDGEFYIINGTIDGNVPCFVQADHAGMTGGGCHVTHGMEIDVNRNFSLEVSCWPGSTVIHIGKGTVLVHRDGQPLLGSLRKQYQAIAAQMQGVSNTYPLDYASLLAVARRFVRGTLEAIGISTWWERIATVAILALFMFKTRSTTVLGVLLALSFLIATANASTGCAIDTERKHMSCGSGVFIWKELPGWWNKFGFLHDNDQDPTTMVYSSLAPGQVNCLACFNHIECAYLADLADDLRSVDDTLPNRKHVVVLNDEQTPGFFPKMEADIPESTTVPKRKAKRGLLERAIRWVKDKKRDDAKETAIMVTATGDSAVHDGTCEVVHLFYFRISGFSLGVFKTMAYTELFQSELTPEECPIALMGQGSKLNAVIGDQSQWLEGKRDEEDVAELFEITLHEYRECNWPKGDLSQGWTGDNLIMPKNIAGPPSLWNTITGYGSQTKAPWHLVPLRVRREECPDTEVSISPTCGATGSSVRSTTSKGRVITDWCCLSCTLPPLSFWTEDGHCWYAQEIRPISKLPGQITTEFDTTLTTAEKVAIRKKETDSTFGRSVKTQAKTRRSKNE